MSKSLVVGHGTVFTLGNPGRVIEDGAGLIEGDTIVEVGKTDKLKKKGKKIIDAEGRVIMPGLVCAHHHLYSTFACGISSAPANNFVEVLDKLWWKLDRALDEKDVYYSALIPLIRCIKSGTTTLLDHHASPNAIEGSLGIIGDAVEEAGLRASLCYEVTDRNGKAGAKAGIRENAAWLERCKGSERLHGLVGVHAAMTVDDETLGQCIALAKEHGVGLHIHVAEDKADQDDSLAKHGKRVLERLHALGGLGPKTLTIHCIHIDDRERELLRQTDTIVVHNPQSNMNNAVGCADVPALLQKGIRVCLGTDGMTSNMLEEARAALFVRHHATPSPSVGWMDTVTMLENNARVASGFFGKQLGVLEPGAAADVIVTNHVPFTPASPANVWGHILFGVAAAGIHTTLCAGKVLMRAGELTRLNEVEICRKALKRTPATWRRFAKL
jgi:putative selenium metabolism protein SsnA